MRNLNWRSRLNLATPNTRYQGAINMSLISFSSRALYEQGWGAGEYKLPGHWRTIIVRKFDTNAPRGEGVPLPAPFRQITTGPSSSPMPNYTTKKLAEEGGMKKSESLVVINGLTRHFFSTPPSTTLHERISRPTNKLNKFNADLRASVCSGSSVGTVGEILAH